MRQVDYCENFEHCTTDIPREAVDVIKGLQPYVRKDQFRSHPLWQLNRLCNLDKHATMAFSHTDTQVKTSGPPVDIYRRDSDDSVELAVTLFVKDEVRIEPQVPEMVFGRPLDAPGEEFTVTDRDLAEMHRFVHEEVLPRFARFFPTAFPNVPQPTSSLIR